MGDPLSLRMERPNGETAPIGVKRPDLAVYLEPKPIKLSIMPPAAGYDSGYTTPLRHNYIGHHYIGTTLGIRRR